MEVDDSYSRAELPWLFQLPLLIHRLLTYTAPVLFCAHRCLLQQWQRRLWQSGQFRRALHAMSAGSLLTRCFQHSHRSNGCCCRVNMSSCSFSCQQGTCSGRVGLSCQQARCSSAASLCFDAAAAALAMLNLGGMKVQQQLCMLSGLHSAACAMLYSNMLTACGLQDSVQQGCSIHGMPLVCGY